MADQTGLTTEFTPWTGRIGADTVVSPAAAHLVRVLPLTGFEERGIRGELELGDQITTVLNEIARTSRGFGRRRPNDPTGMYREVKLLAVRVPSPTRPPHDQNPVLAARQRPWLENIERTVPLAALTVKLQQSSMWSGKNLMSGLRHGASAIAAGTITAASVEKDRSRMMTACAQGRCTTPTGEEWQTLVGWYNHGGTANPPILFHHDHVHVFTHAGLQDLDYEIRRGNVGSRADCHDWPGDLAGHHCFAIGSIVSVTGVNAQEGFDADSVELPVLDERVGWVTEAFNAGALACVSSFFLEPGKIVAKGLEDNRERIDQDINRDYQKGKWGKAEYEAQLKAADSARDYYATGGRAAAIQVSSLVAMPVEWPWHNGFDWDDMSHRVGATFAPIETPFMVRKAFAEMQLGADTRVAPQPGEVGTEWLGYSKFSACETGGEKKGIYLGRTVGDDQPAWLDLDAGFDAESLPMMLVQAASGGGKSSTLAEVIIQGSFEQRDGVIGNFKPLDDTYKAIGERLAATGHPVRYFSLDDLKGRDGAFDPFKMRDPKHPDRIVPGAAQRAADLIMSVHPWGNLGQTPPGAEQRLLEWLQDGVNWGARCVGEALLKHREDAPPNDGDLPASKIIDPILAYARDSDMFRMFIGIDPESDGWSTGSGLTIIERGYSSIAFPAEGSTYQDWNMSQRATAAFINSFIDGVSYGLAYRRGFFAIDEVWAVNEVDKGALQRAGRLWRQFRIFVAITDQRMSGMSHLSGFASRIMVGYNRDPDEARLALESIGAPVSKESISQMRQWAFVPGENGGVRRGALWLFRDVTDRLVLVEQIPNPNWQVRSSDVAATYGTVADAAEAS